METHHISAERLTLARVGEILNKKMRLALSDDARRRITECRDYLDRKMAECKEPIYGITTGFGSLCNISIGHDDLSQLQKNLVMSHSCGVGERVPADIVRLMLLTKIQSLSYGNSGVQLATVERLINFFNADVLPVEGQLQLIRDLQPQAETVGIVYTTSEANSVYSIGVYEELAASLGFTIETVGVTAQSEVTQAVDTLISRGVDCISNLTDNTVVGVLPAILEKTNEAGIPVYGSEVEQMKLGCVAGAGLDYIKLGIQTGQMAAKVLRGEATCQELPYEVIENYDLYINPEALSAMGIAVPDSVASAAIDVTK